MLYKEKSLPFDDKIFKNPPSAYRGLSFWAWNCDMTHKDIDFMMQSFADMGLGGGFLQSRTGMSLPYLKEEYMDRIKYAVRAAKNRGISAWLYDEDRWPSGYAGGYITKNEEHRSRVLLFSPEPQNMAEADDVWGQMANGKSARSNNRRLLAVYTVKLDPDGWLESYKRISEKDAENEDKNSLWYAYLEIAGKNPWFNDQAYANLLNPETVREFIRVTYDAYNKEVGNDFGGAVPAIFTDEPQFSFKENLGKSTERKLVSVPFTDDLPETFAAQYGEDLMELLPELFFDKKEFFPRVRYRFHEHITERFVSSYMDQLGAWCEEHGIALTGHVMREATLKLQSMSIGEAMRFYRAMQLPGFDMLAFRTEYNTAKQCQSAAHQYGREAVLSELYGVTNWDFDFRGHKVLGDWQTALGCTVRTLHLSWTSMAGEAKRDYPASIGYQSPWYKEYKLIEDYFSRVNTALTRGKCSVNLGVIHPIESYWLAYGTDEKTGQLRAELDENFDMLTAWLIGDTKDFDLISESLSETLYGGVENKRLKIGEMSYSTLLVPNMLTMRKNTFKMLRSFKEAGGRIVFTGYTPEYLDAEPNDEVKKFVSECEWVSFHRQQLLSALDGVSELDIFEQDGTHTSNLITQMREDGEERWVFVAHKPENGNEKIVGADAYTQAHPRIMRMKKDRTEAQKITLAINGAWSAIIYDAMSGKTYPAKTEHKNGRTHLNAKLYAHDSLLVRFVPKQDEVCKEEKPLCKKQIQIERCAPVTLSEPNVLLLDMAQYSFDGEPWQEKDEILRIDNKFRDVLGIAYRMEAFPQPWVLKQEKSEEHTLALRFEITSEIKVKNTFLALEHPQDCKITFNGKKISNKICGNYVDRDIFKISLGTVKKGKNILTVSMPFCMSTDVENMYLLGDFGVRVFGTGTLITKPSRSLEFCDWTQTGLAFYGGAVTYRIEFEGSGKRMLVQLNKFRAPVISVSLNGKVQGAIALSPYTVETEKNICGKNVLELTVYGNRFNTFGIIHHTEDHEDNYCSPNKWRSKDEQWCYEYQLRKTGPLKAPDLFEIYEKPEEEKV